MGTCNSNFTLIYLNIFFFSLFIFSLTASSQLLTTPLLDIVCKSVDCGQGTCVASNTTLLGFDCECNPGFSKAQIGPLTFPSCVLPNCTIDFTCGSGAPPPPLQPFPLLTNLTSPCAFVWCGDGNCVVNDTKYYCQCFDGSANLFQLPTAACFKQCYFGADCDGVQLGHNPPPSPSSSASPGNRRSKDVPNCSRNLRALTILVLSAIFLTWI